jgi:tRNA1(Val) A37 N6-methylase TrmN6
LVPNCVMAEAPAENSPRLGTDAFLGGQLQLCQPAEGHRSGTDAVLLAASAPADFSGLAIDAGAGVGAAGLAMAIARPRMRVGFLENDPLLAGLARKNLLHNALQDRGYVVEADLLSAASRRAAGLIDESADLVISNPPFLDPGRARLSPDARRRRAHAMSAEGPSALAAWIAASLALVAPGGLIILIHRPDALPVILESLGGCAGGATVLPVYPRRESDAARILVRGKKGSRAPMAIAPGLLLHDGNGFTPAAEAIHRGASLIDW